MARCRSGRDACAHPAAWLVAYLSLGLLLCPTLARAQTPPATQPAGPAETQSAAPPPDATAPANVPASDPWYKGSRVQVGGFVKAVTVDLTQLHGDKLKANMHSEYALTPAFLASGPEWKLHTTDSGNVWSWSIYFGFGTSTVDLQKIDKPSDSKSNDSSNSSTSNSTDYQGFGTSLDVTYSFLTPTLIFTVPGTPRTWRFGFGYGLGAAQVKGTTILTPDGSIHYNSSGSRTGQEVKADVDESAGLALAGLLFVECIYKQWVFSIGGGGPTFFGKDYNVQATEIRLGLAYEFQL